MTEDVRHEELYARSISESEDTISILKEIRAELQKRTKDTVISNDDLTTIASRICEVTESLFKEQRVMYANMHAKIHINDPEEPNKEEYSIQ